MLQKFVKTGKQCGWTDKDGNHLCDRDAVKTKLNVEGKTMLCLRHQLIMLSGRVGPNRKRDHYRENLKPYCEMSGRTWASMYHEVKAGINFLAEKFPEKNIDTSRRNVIRRTCQQFDVDHKDGNHYNNNVSNLQTLTKSMHKLKTDVMGDADPTKKSYTVQDNLRRIYG